MKAFSELFTRIDQTTSTNEKVDAIAHYFSVADEADMVWCVALLTGKRPKRTVRSGELRDWSVAVSGLPQWLLEESYHIVGDLAETITLVLPQTEEITDYSLHEIMQELINLDGKDEQVRKDYIDNMWRQLSGAELFVFNKLITGSFRMGVSEKIVIKALAKHYKLDENVVAHRIIGKWDPQTTSISDLLTVADIRDDISRPYPFYLAYALDMEPQDLGDVKDWQIERKYDGIRGEIIVREQQLFVWSRGEDLMTEKFVEFHPLASILPNCTVIDGEILPMQGDDILPFHVMQTRIGRKNITRKTLQDAPLVMICYDLIEYKGEDLREMPLYKRRELLEEMINEVRQDDAGKVLRLSPIVDCETWEQAAEERGKSREYTCEGLMLKLKESTYKTGRRRGEWWKWKVDPYSVDGVLIYAQRGHGRRANLYTDFTFAVWDGEELVPFTKAYSGLTDKELLRVDAWIKRNTLDKFGPVRSVVPQLVFELGFEGINPSPRHKSGVALRFPRILRWREDKTAKEANTKTDLLELLNIQS